MVTDELHGTELFQLLTDIVIEINVVGQVVTLIPIVMLIWMGIWVMFKYSELNRKG